MLDDLGLVVPPRKVCFIPQQKITFLGFVIDFIEMIVRLNEDKIWKTKEVLLSAIHNSHSVKIQDIARIIRYLISSFLGVKYGALYFRYLEMVMIKHLNNQKAILMP